MSKNEKDQPLKFEIKGGKLVISIGIERLAFCAEHDVGSPRLKILNAKTLAEDVIRELKDEREDGSTIFTDLTDLAINNAHENGSTAFSEEPVPIR